MKLRLLGTAGVIAVLLSTLAPHVATAADVQITGAGPAVLRVPGLPPCSGVASVVLKTNGTDFAFFGLIVAGAGSVDTDKILAIGGPEDVGNVLTQIPAAICASQNLYYLYSSKHPEVRQCVAVPVLGGAGVVEGPATIAYNAQTKTYTASRSTPGCAGTATTIVHTLNVAAAATIGYSYRLTSGPTVLTATATLTRAPLP